MFRQFRNIQMPLYAPTDVVAGGDKVLSRDNILEELMKDDKSDEDVIPLEDKDKKPEKKAAKKDDDKEVEDEDKEDDKEEDEEDEDTEEEDDELKDLEDELDEPDEDKLELTTPTSRREILKKYPKIFKDFPYLETAFYREQAFTKILPTIADAKEAVEKSQTLDNFERDLSSGNTEVVLNAIKTSNPKAFNKVVDNYLTVLSRVDEKAYQHVLGNTIKHTIMAMVEEARASSNEPLEQAANILNQFMFGSSKFTPPSKLSNEDDKSNESDDKEQKLTEREQRFIRQKFNTANEELSTKVNKAYKLTIEAKIDPKESMTEYVRKTATRDALEELESLIEKDTRFKVLVDKLWENAFKNDFDEASLTKIRRAFISKAQTLLPSVIQKARIAALKGMGKRVREDDDSRPEKDESNKGDETRRRNVSNKGEESHRRNDSSTKKVPAGMSTLDYLMAED